MGPEQDTAQQALYQGLVLDLLAVVFRFSKEVQGEHHQRQEEPPCKTVVRIAHNRLLGGGAGVGGDREESNSNSEYTAHVAQEIIPPGQAVSLITPHEATDYTQNAGENTPGRRVVVGAYGALE